MFEARLVQGAILKKIIEAIRELVTDANLDCSSTGISMQVIIIHLFMLPLNLCLGNGLIACLSLRFANES
jgi:hypothetical protein